MILAAAAARTSRIRLTSAVAVSAPSTRCRMFQQFATLDLLSQGRAEMVVGRGSFIDAFPLFGLRLEDYDSLFEEHLDLLLKIRDNEHVEWAGRHRPALTGQGSIRGRSRIRCRSGSASVARRNRSLAPARSGCR